jgi:hypothetical protein
MKQIVLAVIFSMFTVHSFSQGMYGIQGGKGKATAFKAHTTPKIECYLLGQVGYRLFIGGSIGIERYSLIYNSGKTADNAAVGDIVSIRQKSSYLYFSPKADYSIGYRKILHVHASVGGGIFMSGRQVTNMEQAFPAPAATLNYAEDKNTTNNIPLFMLRYGAGISERLPTLGFWNVTFSQEFGYLGKSFHKDAAPDLRTDYIAFTIGIMHNYNQVLVEY